MTDVPAGKEASAEPSLHRVMGPWLLLLFIVGDILGAGVYAVTGRIEKGYRLMGAELESEYDPVEAGLARPKVKSADFIGKQQYLAAREAADKNGGPAAVMCTLSMDSQRCADGYDRFRAEPIMIDQLMEKTRGGNVEVRWNSELDEVLGDDTGVTGVRVRDKAAGGTAEIPLQGVFVAIGHTPNSGFITRCVRASTNFSRTAFPSRPGCITFAIAPKIANGMNVPVADFMRTGA